MQVSHVDLHLDFTINGERIYIHTYIYIYIYIYVSCVSNPMSQNFPGYSPPQLKKKVPINIGLKVNRFRDIHCCVEIRGLLWLTRNTLL